MRNRSDTVSGRNAKRHGRKREESNKSQQPRRPKSHGCGISFNIHCKGDVNIYNCPKDCGSQSPCDADIGGCIPVVAGAKHKLSRAQRLHGIATKGGVPSGLAAGTLHMLRRFLVGKSAANAMEAAVFAGFSHMSPAVTDVMRCASSAYEDLPADQRGLLVGTRLNLELDEPLTPAALSDAWARELSQRLALQLFGDIAAADQARPGRIRVYEPQGEDFFSQVRICSVNSLRTANYIPPLAGGDYLPAEIQQDCAPVIVNGQPQVVCQVRTADCPGNSGPGFCARVLDIAPGDGLMLEGVNYFSVNAKVRLTARAPLSVTRDIDAFVWGDETTPVTDVATGTLINDCRVQDRLSFRVPDDLPPAIYEMNVVVPNVTGIVSLGDSLISNSEFINVLPPVNARFNVVAESIASREETSPAWFGSDEVGLHTMSTSLLLDGTLSSLEPLETEFQGDDFDSGEPPRDITRIIYEQKEVIKAIVVVVMGYEIDSQHAYDEMISNVATFLWDAIKVELPFIAAASAALVTKFGWWGVIAAAVGIAIVAAVDLIYAFWAPADPIIFDSIGLSIGDLVELTSANYPLPDARSFSSANGILVNVSPLEKIPLQYRERREYVSDEQESRYEIVYRVNRVA
jgi:hypothetical protein